MSKSLSKLLCSPVWMKILLTVDLQSQWWSAILNERWMWLILLDNPIAMHYTDMSENSKLIMIALTWIFNKRKWRIILGVTLNIALKAGMLTRARKLKGSKQMVWKLKKATSADSWQQGGRDLAAFTISSCCFPSHYVEVQALLSPQADIRQGSILATSCSYFMCHQVTR